MKSLPPTVYITKRLNKQQQLLLNKINDTLEGQLKVAEDWLRSDEARQYYTGQRKLEANFFNNIENNMSDLLNKDSKDYMSHFEDLYKLGADKGYSQLFQDAVWTEADKRAMFHVQQYGFDRIRKLSEDCKTDAREAIWRGVAEGQSMDKVARNIRDIPLEPLTNSNMSPEVRAQMIAYTETSRAVNAGTIQSYANYGIEKVDIVTAGDDSVCEDCIAIEEDNPYTLTEASNLLPVHPNCYDEITEVYTNHGWKLFKDIIKDEDEVLSLNPETRETEFIKDYNIISHVNDYEYMYWIHNQWFDTCVTPDHDCFIYQRKSKDKVRSLYHEFRKPTELNTESKFYRTCNNNNVSPEVIDVNGLKFKPEDYAFFMAWYISEGSILHNVNEAKQRGYAIDIIQVIPENRKVLEKELTRICEYLNLKLGVRKDRYQIYSKELYEYLKPLGYSNEKYTPNELFSLSRSDLNIFLDNYVKGDGNERESSNKVCCNSFERTLFTSSTHLVDDLSYIILLAGYYPSIKVMSKAGTVVKHHNGSYAQNYDVYSIRINRSEYATVPNLNIDKVDYTDMVYCIALPKYHTLWTKRNGKTTWNGNCRCVYSPVIDLPTDQEVKEAFENLEPVDPPQDTDMTTNDTKIKI
jgi:SPP1 gp7 family putative phage head morphogenesis protein